MKPASILFLLLFCFIHAFSQDLSMEGLAGSDLFSVFVDDRQVWTEKCTSDMDTSKLPGWFSEPYVREVQEIHITDFILGKPGRITVELNRETDRVTIRPLSRNIQPAISGSRISFPMNDPDFLVIEVESLPPLFLFANAPEEATLPTNDEDVLYFGPGVHHAGYIRLKDNQTVYIAKGGIVYGGLRGDSVSNIAVKGRGILDGRFEYQRMVTFDHSRNITVEGITIRNSKGWTNTLTNCDSVIYKGVKVISFGPGGDGINPLNSRNVTISHCFLRCTDDCIAIKSPHKGYKSGNITVKDNVMLGHAYSDGVTIGFETNEDISGVYVNNCDILLARGGSRVDGHSGFSIICDGPGVISNVRYENIRVEKAEDKLFEIHITDGTKYGIDPPGQIRNVTLKNIHWLHPGPVIIRGHDEGHLVQDVVFEDCHVGDKPLMDLQHQIVEHNPFTKNIAVVQAGVRKILVH